MALEEYHLSFPEPTKLTAPLRHEPENNHTIAYRPYGNISTATKIIVTVHGLTADSLNFHYFCEYLLQKDPNYAIINIDIMGRGESQDLSKGPHGNVDSKNYTYLQYVDDIVVILKHIREQNDNDDTKFFWIGTSMGGLLGIILSSRYEELSKCKIKFNALMFNDIGPLVPWNEIERIAKYVVVDSSFTSREEALHYFEKIYKAHFGPKTDTKFFAHRALYALHENDQGELKVGYDRKGVAHGLVDQEIGELINHPIIGQSYSFQSYFNQLDVPLLVYRGKLSVLLPQVFLDEMEENYKQRGLEFESIVWDDTGHVPPLYHEEELEPLYQWFEKH